MPTPVVVSRIQNRRGTQDQFTNLYPPGYEGVGPYDTSLYPNILLPGELALCTDSRRIFLGNLNGEYVEISLAISPTDIQLLPLVFDLPPSPTFVSLPSPGLKYLSTPFFNLLYDVTDAASPDWNTPGTNLTKNGSMQITANATNATLSDTCTEMNNLLPADISFRAVLVGPEVEIQYMHDFAGNVTFSTSSIHWLPF